MNAPQPKRGEIYWVDWSPARGSEQAGLRPAVVVQNDIANRVSPNTVVVALSTAPLPKLYPFIVALAAGEAGLKEAGHINCSQLMTISKSRLKERIGELSEERKKQVSAALRVHLDAEP